MDARYYRINKYHTDRIDRIIYEGKFVKEYSKRNIILFKNHHFFLYKLILKTYRILTNYLKK